MMYSITIRVRLKPIIIRIRVGFDHDRGSIVFRIQSDSIRMFHSISIQCSCPCLWLLFGGLAKVFKLYSIAVPNNLICIRLACPSIELVFEWSSLGSLILSINGLELWRFRISGALEFWMDSQSFAAQEPCSLGIVKSWITATLESLSPGALAVESQGSGALTTCNLKNNGVVEYQ